MSDMTPEQLGCLYLAELERCLVALYICCDKTVADDVNRIVRAAIRAAEIAGWQKATKQFLQALAELREEHTKDINESHDEFERDLAAAEVATERRVWEEAAKIVESTRPSGMPHHAWEIAAMFRAKAAALAKEQP